MDNMQLGVIPPTLAKHHSLLFLTKMNVPKYKARKISRPTMNGKRKSVHTLRSYCNISSEIGLNDSVATEYSCLNRFFFLAGMRDPQ